MFGTYLIGGGVSNDVAIFVSDCIGFNDVVPCICDVIADSGVDGIIGNGVIGVAQTDAEGVVRFDDVINGDDVTLGDEVNWLMELWASIRSSNCFRRISIISAFVRRFRFFLTTGVVSVATGVLVTLATDGMLGICTRFSTVGGRCFTSTTFSVEMDSDSAGNSGMIPTLLIFLNISVCCLSRNSF